MSDGQFRRLVVCYLEGTLDEQETAQLQQELRDAPARQRLFVQLAMVRRGTIELSRNRAWRETEESSAPAKGTQPDPATELSDTMVMPAITDPDWPQEIILPGPPSVLLTQPTQAMAFWKRTWLRAAVVLLIPAIAIIAWKFSRPSTLPSTEPPPVAFSPAAVDPPTTAVTAATPVLATVHYSLNATWDSTGHDLAVQSALSPLAHTLDSGIAQIDLLGGAQVVLQAPVQFQVISPTLLQVTSGQVSATVPHGSQGLTVTSPDLRVVDLGTEFGLNVQPVKRTHVEVFTGQVRAELPASNGGSSLSQVVSANQAVAIQSGGQNLEKDVPAPLSFVRTDEIQRRSLAGGNAGSGPWRAISDELRRDPQLIAYYTFEKDAKAPGQLSNLALATAGRHGGVLGLPGLANSAPDWSTGRWPDKGALNFGDGRTTAVMLQSDGAFVPSKNLTILFWLRRSENSLPIHLINRQHNNHGSLNVSLLGTNGKNRDSSKRKVLLPNSIYFNFGPGEICLPGALPADNEWLQVAITVDEQHFTRFFINGTLAGQMPMNVADNVDPVGDVCVGRSAPGNGGADSNDIFRGCMDELAFLNRALSDAEVRRLYDAGAPMIQGRK